MRVSMKTFSTAGPVKLDEHYNIPALGSVEIHRELMTAAQA